MAKSLNDFLIASINTSASFLKNLKGGRILRILPRDYMDWEMCFYFFRNHRWMQDAEKFWGFWNGA